MSVTVDDAAPQWSYFLASNASCSSSREAIGWNQLADNATADTNGLWNGTETWTSTPGASMMIAFQGTELFLYSTLSPDGGYMSVIIDNITTPVSLNNSEVLYGSWVFSVEGLDPSWMHAVTITMLNGTNVNVDKVSIQPPTPNAFPPAWPQVELAALPNQTGIQLPSCAAVTPTPTITPVAETTTTEMSTTTVIETDRTKPTKNNDVEMAGVIVGTAFAVAIVVIIGFFVHRFFSRRKSMIERRESDRRSDRGHLRQLLSGTMFSGRSSGGQRHSRLRTSDSVGSFGNVKPETITDDVEEKRHDIEKGSTGMEKLPSIRHPSTIAIDMGSMFSRSTTPVSLHPQPPAPVRGQSPLSRLKNSNRSVDEPRKGWHTRSRGFPFSLSIDTNMKSTRSSVGTKTRSSGWLTDDEVLNRTSKAMSNVGPSRLGGDHGNTRHIEGSQEDGVRSSRAISISGGSDRDGTETAEFYAAYARAGFLQNEPEEYEDVDDDEETSLNQGKGRDGEDYEDDSIDTPLIPPSPAIPSSNASMAHGSSGFYSFSSGKRGSKASKVLRSFRSRSSMRHSVGRRSTQSSAEAPKSPEVFARTPKTPLSSRASMSTRSRKSSAPSVSGHGISPDVPAVPEITSGGSGAVIVAGLGANSGPGLVEPLAPPSAWSESKKRLLMRPYKPAFGPRARSESAASTSSAGSSGFTHDQSADFFPERRDASILSVVDENIVSGRE